jgi:multidrug efflux pump subunit AcrA (membrane-fusion protein)
MAAHSPASAGLRRPATTAPTRAPKPERADQGHGLEAAPAGPPSDAPTINGAGDSVSAPGAAGPGSQPGTAADRPATTAPAASPAAVSAPSLPPHRQPAPFDELPPAPRKRGWVRAIALLAVILVVGTVGSAIGFHFWYEGTYFVVTDNAQVTGDLIQVGSLNAGRIVTARFEVGQAVQAGQEMAVIRIPQELDMAMGGTMVLEEPSAGDRLASVRAPFSGVVVARLSHVGGTVAAGQPIYSVVDPNRVWIKANIEETKLARLQAGQAVDVHVDALGHGVAGRVAAITPASAATFSLLPSQNASGNFVKVTQLVPVKIQVDAAGLILPLGTSATVRIKVREPDGGVPWNP